MYSAEQALEQIWNDSGNEGDLFDSNESEFEMYSASKDNGRICPWNTSKDIVLFSVKSTQPMNKEEFMKTSRRKNLEAIESHDVNEESGLVEDVGNAIIEGDARFIDGEGRHVFQERMNNMRLLYDDGRLPYAMLSKMSRGKNFIVTFARECLWKQVAWSILVPQIRCCQKPQSSH
ncbi:hypothetical protein P5673_025067 [Acropora cervicornis]|uniref:Uncharacterized protein n=1 Tax=Acropora cervicornis TaxID=6130 RepID=A0AAD9UXI9_ACRCE|nr:hypothetical protein P5673_025067 [Acropora cervicornis]